MLPFAVAANRQDRPIEKREEERASFTLSPFECGMQSPQLSQLPLVTSVITDQSTYGVQCTVARVQCLAPFGAQWHYSSFHLLYVYASAVHSMMYTTPTILYDGQSRRHCCHRHTMPGCEIAACCSLLHHYCLSACLSASTWYKITGHS